MDNKTKPKAKIVSIEKIKRQKAIDDFYKEAARATKHLNNITTQEIRNIR